MEFRERQRFVNPI